MSSKDRLYKYTKLEYVRSMLNNGIFASTIDKMNDPYEYKDIENPQNFRIISLTRSANAKLMWSHYADNHRGCSVQIELPEGYGSDDFILKRVTYSSKYSRKEAMTDGEIVSNLYIKDKKWSNEIEVRAVYNDNNYDDTYWNFVDGNVYFKARIKAINFGCMINTESDEYERLLMSIDTYNNINKNNKIEVKKYKMDNNKFRFILDNEYKYEKELLRLKSKETIES